MERALTGQVALVTGGAVRVGRALSLALARAGATVAVHCHGSQPEGERLVAELVQEGARADLFAADLTADGAPEALVAAVGAKLGPLGILVNSAARFDRARFLETPAALLDAAWALNTRAPYLLAQAAARAMLPGGGHILNILDIGGTFQPWQGYSAYCMTKAALGMLTQCLALELAPAIRVNAVAPGTVMPPEAMAPEELRLLRERIPLQRFGTPEDIAQTALFLLTGPTFITGQIIAVDGGRMRGVASPEALGTQRVGGR